MIDTKALRSKVLDLAIQGKLTEQNENEVIYYQDIIILKENPHTIPNNWKWTNIQSIIKKDVGGGTPSKSIKDYWNNGSIPWMSVKDFSSAQNGLLSDTTDHITELGLKNSSSNLVDENAIIICMRMALGKIVKISKPMAINQDLRAIWLKEFIDNNYFFYFYSTLKVEGHGMTVAGISKKQLMEYPFPLPPLAEQKRIVERVEEIFKLLDIIDEAQKKYSADAEILKSKLITMGIQGKLTKQLDSDGTAEELYQQIQEEKQKLIKEGKIKATLELPTVTDEEKLFDVPVNWKWTHFGNMAYIVRGGSPRPIKQYITNDINGINWIKIGDVEKGGKYIFNTREKIIPEGEKKSRRVYPGDFLLTNSMSFGRPYISKIEGCIHDGWLLIRNLNGFNADYLYYLLSSSYLYAQFCNKAVGATVDNLNIEKVCSALIPLPPLAEQKRIAQVLDEVLNVISR